MLSVARGWAGAGLGGTQGWEVTAGSPEQRPPGSAGGLLPALIPPDPQEWPPRAPWCPGPETHTVCPGDQSPSGSAPAPCSVHCPLLRAIPGAPSVSPVTSEPSVGSPQTPQGESVHSALGCSGVRTEGASVTQIPLRSGSSESSAGPVEARPLLCRTAGPLLCVTCPWWPEPPFLCVSPQP